MKNSVLTQNKVSTQVAVTSQNEITANIFETPKLALVSEVLFSDGKSSQMITAIPKGINIDNIRDGFLHGLKMQGNVISCQCKIAENLNGIIDFPITYQIFDFTNLHHLNSLYNSNLYKSSPASMGAYN